MKHFFHMKCLIKQQLAFFEFCKVISCLQILEFKKGVEEGVEKRYAVLSVVNSHPTLNIRRESTLASTKKKCSWKPKEAFIITGMIFTFQNEIRNQEKKRKRKKNRKTKFCWIHFDILTLPIKMFKPQLQLPGEWQLLSPIELVLTIQSLNNSYRKINHNVAVYYCFS